MKLKNSDRNLLKIVKEVCSDNNIEINLLSQDWIIELKKDRECRYIFGYNFEINSSTAQMIAQDKCAAFAVLNKKNIPVVEHFLFMSPTIHKYFDGKGNWSKIVSFFNENNKIVCKPTKGTGGNNVFVIDNLIDLEIIVHRLLSQNRSISLSPFYQIDNEYRIIVLDNEPLVIYSKSIPFIIGDGISTTYDLICAKFKEEEVNSLLTKSTNINLQRVLKKDEKFDFHWKHNLGIIAKPHLIEDNLLREKLSKIAIAACNAINIRFASVDIVSVEGKLMVLEINSGVMGESFSRSSEKAYNLTKKIYQKAIFRMFE